MDDPFKTQTVDDVVSEQMAGDLTAPAPQSETPTNQENPVAQPEEDLGLDDYAIDTVLGVGKGVLGFGQSVVELADYLVDDAIPDWDWREVSTESKTWSGTLAQGVTQFLMGFLPAGAVLKGAGMAAKGLGAASKLQRPANFLKFDKILRASDTANKVRLNGKGMWAAGAVSDFVSFDGQEERLSNFLSEFPALKNPVVEYLAADEDDNEIEGRFKNVIEGMFMEFGLTIPLAKAFGKGIDAIKRGRGDVNADDVVGSLDEKLAQIKSDVDEIRTLDDMELDITGVKTDDLSNSGKVVDDTEGKVDVEEEVKVDADGKAIEPDEVKADGEDVKVDDVDVDADDLKSTPIGVYKENLKKQAEAIIDPTIDIGRGTVRAPIAENAGDLEDIVNATADAAERLSVKSGVTSNEDIISNAAKEWRDKGRTDDADKLLKDYELAKESDMHLEQLAESIKFRNGILANQTQLTSDMMGLVEKIKGIKDIESEEFISASASFDAMWKQYADLNSMRSKFNSQYGTALQQAKIGLTDSQRKAKVNMPEGSGLTEQKRFHEDPKFGLDPQEKNTLIDILAAKQEDFLRDPRLAMDMMDIATKKHKLGDKLYTYWINSLLSGPKTMAVNIVSASFNSILKSMFVAGGSLLAGDPALSKAMIKAMTRSTFQLQSLSMIGKGMKSRVSPFEGVNGKPTNDALQRIDDPIGWMWGNVVSIPTKILGSSDAAMKHFNFSVAARAKLMHEAMTKAKITDGVEAAKYVEERMNKILLEGGSINNSYNVRNEAIAKMKKSGEWDTLSFNDKSDKLSKLEKEAAERLEGYSSLQEFGRDWADEATFTNDLGKYGKKIEGFVKKIPAARWIVPFVRTPINVIKTSLDISTAAPRMALGKGRESFNSLRGVKTTELEKARKGILEAWYSDDPMRRAEARGKVAFSTSALFAIHQVINNDYATFTGSGPANPAQRKRMEDAGWQKYSIKVGDKYYSYQRLDPIAMLIGSAADIRDMSNDPATMDSNMLEKLFASTVVAVNKNILEKTFLTGLDSFLASVKDPDKLKKWTRNFGASFIPSVIPQTHELITGSPMNTEVWSYMDAIQKRSVFNPAAMDAKRNILGEEIDHMDVAGIMDRGIDMVANISDDTDDIVLDEIASLRQGFDLPRKVIGAGINLIDFEDENGRTAYDFYRAAHGTTVIGGKTLRQSLTKVIKSRWYQKIDPRSAPNFKSQRITELQKVIGRYRREALQDTLDAFPDLKEQYDISNSIRSSQRAGRDVFSEVEELYNITR